MSRKGWSLAKRILVGTRKGLFTLVRSEDAWEIAHAAFVGDNVPIVSHDTRDDAIYAALEHGHFGTKLHRSTDGGQSWDELGVPQYPQPQTTENPEQPTPTATSKLEKIWALEPGLANEPGRLWCGTIPGGLFRSDDSGRTWNLVETLWDHPGRKEWFGGGADLPGIHSICVDPRDASTLFVGVSCGGVWVTHDSGASWDCQATGMWAAYLPPEQKGNPNKQDPHRLVQCRSRPDHFWVQHHNGIFRSMDGSRSWNEATDTPLSNFGFAVAVHPQDPETAWFVPGINDEKRIPVDGKLAVTRTRDGGRSFDVLRSGLPQEHAYDLIYRHALDICASGETLAFGSTTGSVWVSDDQGDHWQAVSHNLPPVYSVRVVG